MAQCWRKNSEKSPNKAVNGRLKVVHQLTLFLKIYFTVRNNRQKNIWYVNLKQFYYGVINYGTERARRIPE